MRTVSMERRRSASNKYFRRWMEPSSTRNRRRPTLCYQTGKRNQTKTNCINWCYIKL
jgi:hypothetical protein